MFYRRVGSYELPKVPAVFPCPPDVFRPSYIAISTGCGTGIR